MNVIRYLKGLLSVRSHHWQGWVHISFQSFWGGRLLYLNISKFSVHLDCRENWIEDMVNADIK